MSIKSNLQDQLKHNNRSAGSKKGYLVKLEKAIQKEKQSILSINFFNLEQSFWIASHASIKFNELYKKAGKTCQEILQIENKDAVLNELLRS